MAENHQIPNDPSSLLDGSLPPAPASPPPRKKTTLRRGGPSSEHPTKPSLDLAALTAAVVALDGVTASIEAVTDGLPAPPTVSRIVVAFDAAKGAEVSGSDLVAVVRTAVGDDQQVTPGGPIVFNRGTGRVTRSVHVWPKQLAKLEFDGAVDPIVAEALRRTVASLAAPSAHLHFAEEDGETWHLAYIDTPVEDEVCEAVFNHHLAALDATPTAGADGGWPGTCRLVI
jgi:hypothetical protein